MSHYLNKQEFDVFDELPLAVRRALNEEPFGIDVSDVLETAWIHRCSLLEAVNICVEEARQRQEDKSADI